VIDRARVESSRLGFFAALYREVTARIRKGIAEGRFEDGQRMEQFDVLFAAGTSRRWRRTGPATR
jgi:hypothetical protein